MSTDAARSVLNDPRAPADERFDARAELERQHRPTSASDLIPAAAVLPFVDALRGGGIAEALGEEMAKAATNVLPFHQPRGGKRSSRGAKSVQVDAQQLAVGGEYVEKPGAIDFGGLRRMVEGTPILSSVVITRIRQMMRYCQPSEDGGPGFIVRHVDKEHEATEGDKEQAKLLMKFFQNGGWEWKPRARKRLGRETFPTTMAKMMRDTLTFDACPLETEFRRDKSGIDGTYAIDGATVRLCTEDGYVGDDSVFAIQVVNGKVATTYDLDQLVYEVRNPRTDVALAGYGLGETELLIKTVTSLLNAVTYNSEFFSDRNTIPKGLLQIFGDYSAEDVAGFRRHWRQMVAGVENRHGLPVMVSKDKESGAVFTEFGKAADEMAFSKWLTFLTSVVCAVYSIDPNEIGFESFSANKSTMSGNDTAEKLAAGRDKGFRPIASFFEGLFTDYVVADFNPDFCFRFEGLEEEDKDRAWEAKKLVCTVDEIRAEEGYKPMEDPQIGALPVNPALIAPAMQLRHPDAVNPQQDDFGEAAEPAEEGEPDFGEGAAPEEGGEEDFGEVPEAEPADGGDDFGPEPPKPEPAKPKARVRKGFFRRLVEWRA